MLKTSPATSINQIQYLHPQHAKASGTHLVLPITNTPFHHRYLSVFKCRLLLILSHFHNTFCGMFCWCISPVNTCTCKGKGLPQQAEMAQGGPVTLRLRIFLTFGTTRVVGRQPYAPVTFTPGETPGTHF